MKITTLLLASVITLSAGPLFAAVNAGDIVGTTEADIRTALESSGYVIEEIKIEKDEIEVEALLDGAAVEIEISGVTGEILEVEDEDNDHEEEDDDAEDDNK